MEEYYMTFIDGYQGPFGNQTALARGLNSGYKVATAAKSDPSSLNNAHIQYTTLENGKLSLNGGYAYSLVSSTALDKNGDGKVAKPELFEIFKRVVSHK